MLSRAVKRDTSSSRRTSGVGKKRTRVDYPPTQVVSIPARMPPSEQMYQLVKQAKMETGYLDTDTAGGALDTAGFIVLLNPVPSGAAQVQRVGKKILLKGLQIRGLVYNGTTAYANDIALVVVYDKRPTGSMPTITAVLKTISSQSMNLDDNASRFRIVRRMDACLIGNSTNPTAQSAISIDEYVDLKKAITVYKSVGTGAIGDIGEGALYLLGVGSAAAGTAAAVATLSARVRYYDP